jgi:hypothetical protein
MAMETLKSARPKYPRPFRGSVIFAPGSGGDLAWFLAIVKYAPVDQDGRAQPITVTFPGIIFAKVDGAWKGAAADVQAPIPQGMFGNGDAALSAPLADDHYIMAASAIASSYAAYLTELSSGARPEGSFATGPSSVADRLTRIPWPPGSIATARFTFEVVDAEIARYSITSGITKVPEVVVFVLRRTAVIKPRKGCLVRSAEDIEWSDIVPAGSYSAVTLRSVAVVAATVPTNDGDTSQGRKVIDISAGIDDVSVAVAKC